MTTDQSQVRRGAPGDPDGGGRLVSRQPPQLRVPVPGRGLHRDPRRQGLGPQPRAAHEAGGQVR